MGARKFPETATTTATDYGSALFGALRQHADCNWMKYIRHEFVCRLGDGSLPRSAFLAYLEQDYLFLLHYARAWAMAVVKSETAGQMRMAAATVNALINEEISLHVRVCEREGITEEALLNAREAPQNIAYTRYVMDTALGGDLLDLLCAMSPCVFGYGEIGCLLADADTEPVYREWIDAYCGEPYQELCRSVAGLVEEVRLARLGSDFMGSPRWESLCSRFSTAVELEAQFWSMGMDLGKPGA